jgi:hypothetical protein
MTLWNPKKPLNQPPHFRTGEAVVTGSTDSEIAALIDKRRELAAQVAGVELEIAMALGDRDGARRHMEEQKAQTLARHAAKFAAWEASH